MIQKLQNRKLDKFYNKFFNTISKENKFSLSLSLYNPGKFYDELFEDGGISRPIARPLVSYLSTLNEKELYNKKAMAELAIIEQGITFTLYSDGENIDRAWPFDIIPRVINWQEWIHVERGLKQRLKAINMFIDDLYNKAEILKANVVPKDIIQSSKNFRKECIGMRPKYGVWANICGSDLVRDTSGQIFVLEDNLRVPSGVSYMLENRKITKQVFPELFENIDIVPVDDYSMRLFEMLCSIAPEGIKGTPSVVVLTPGVFNSAYFEHSFLAQQMSAELVEGCDLMVNSKDQVFMKTITGLEKVDVIYRRVDDDFLDPEVFRKDSLLGVPGLMRAWKKGNVAIANAPGTGVADDKVVYSYVPQIIEFYLGEKPILPNVPTWRCRDEEDLKYVMEHIHELVIKPANESGGYGMLIGPHSTKKQQETFKKLIQENPRNYIAQPTLSLSVAPTICQKSIEPRHVDLRPFILSGENTYVTAGGLTRVALHKGSLVVNSSQGGGSKDTWIVKPKEA